MHGEAMHPWFANSSIFDSKLPVEEFHTQ